MWQIKGKVWRSWATSCLPLILVDIFLSLKVHLNVENNVPHRLVKLRKLEGISLKYRYQMNAVINQPHPRMKAFSIIASNSAHLGLTLQDFNGVFGISQAFPFKKDDFKLYMVAILEMLN